MNEGMGPHSADEYATFVGSNVHKFLPKFSKYRATPSTFQPGWNWAAFFFTFWWFLYRKMYLWAMVGFATFLIPNLGLLVSIGWGIAANYLYFRHATAKITELKAFHGAKSGLYLPDAGGVNTWVPWVALIVTGGFIALLMLGVIGAALFASSWSFWWLEAPMNGTTI